MFNVQCSMLCLFSFRIGFSIALLVNRVWSASWDWESRVWMPKYPIPFTPFNHFQTLSVSIYSIFFGAQIFLFNWLVAVSFWVIWLNSSLYIFLSFNQFKMYAWIHHIFFIFIFYHYIFSRVFVLEIGMYLRMFQLIPFH